MKESRKNQKRRLMLFGGIMERTENGKGGWRCGMKGKDMGRSSLHKNI